MHGDGALLQGPMTTTTMKTRKTNGVLLRNRQIHGEFTVILSLENMFVTASVERPLLSLKDK